MSSAVEDEAKSAVKERKRQIKSVAVEADWILKTSDSSYWVRSSESNDTLVEA